VIFLLCIFAGIRFEIKAQEKPPAGPSQSAEELAKKLANPVSSLISVPLQSNIDYGIGPYHGSKYTLNVQPVIPISLTPKLNLITRYIIPVVDEHNISKEGGNEFGLSDATISGFFSPVKNKNGFIWGAGPAFLIPSGTNDYLSTRKWATGPTAVIVKQQSGYTYGFLVNQLWSFAGDKARSDVNQMFFQPTLTHNWKSGAGLGASAEITFNWTANTTTAFLIPTISGITKLGTQTVSLAVGPRIPLAAPSGGKTDFGFRGLLTFVFPK
jgi:hypothetical protein